MLVIQLDRPVERWNLEPGLYAYVGSAWGPGGLVARVGRHMRGRFKKPKWHVDWLIINGTPLLALLFPNVTEDDLYRAASNVLRPAVRGFGSTDTDHYTHLFVVDDVEKIWRLWKSIPPSNTEGQTRNGGQGGR